MGPKGVTTNSNGVATFTFSPINMVAMGLGLIATATDPAGNTSEFSAQRKVLAR